MWMSKACILIPYVNKTSVYILKWLGCYFSVAQLPSICQKNKKYGGYKKEQFNICVFTKM